MTDNYKNTYRNTIVFTIIILVLFCFALMKRWFGVPNGTGSDFCELAKHSFIIQPVNSFSNIGFVLSGIYCSWLMSNPSNYKNNFFFTHPFISNFFCMITVLLGPCSMAMHATETTLGGLFDMNSMYLFAGFMFAYAITRYYKLSNFHFLILYILNMVVCNFIGQYRTLFGLAFYPGSAVFGFICAMGMFYEYLNYSKQHHVIEFKYAVYCSISFLVAFGVWQFGRTGHCFCNPTSWFQWHGVWHLLCGLSTYFLFKYYISEDVTLNKTTAE